jgi:hypothetical protein
MRFLAEAWYPTTLLPGQGFAGKRSTIRTEDAVPYTREQFEDPAEILNRTWIDD